MALQSSGAISFSELRAEFSDTGSVSMSELYKDGGLVPSTVIEIGAFVSNGTYTTSSYQYRKTGAQAGQWFIKWGGSVLSVDAASNLQVLSGFQYKRGSLAASDPDFDYYNITRATYSSVAVNPNVPASSTITLSDFYNGRGS